MQTGPMFLKLDDDILLNDLGVVSKLHRIRLLSFQNEKF